MFSHRVRRTAVTQRAGKSGGAISIALFLLSCLLAIPVVQWGFRDPPSERIDTYAFSDRNPGRSLAGSSEDSSHTSPLAEPMSPSVDEPTTHASPGSGLSIRGWHHVEQIPESLAQFRTVFWEPRDTESLRDWLSEPGSAVRGSEVLEIGTGTGLIAILCGQQGAARVVATDINPAAVANARYNAERLGQADRLEVRLVPEQRPGPFSVIEPDESFDLIISNPPWEDAPVTEPAAYALFDPGFALLDSLLAEGKQHLNPGGRMLLAYGARAAIERIEELAPAHGWQVTRLDERQLQDLPTVFLPGMLLELKPVRL